MSCYLSEVGSAKSLNQIFSFNSDQIIFDPFEYINYPNKYMPLVRLIDFDRAGIARDN